MQRKDVMERLGISKKRLDHIVCRTNFNKRTKGTGSGCHYNYTEKDMADILKYINAHKEWKLAKEFK